MFPENNLTSPEEVLQMICCKCGAENYAHEKFAAAQGIAIMFEVL